MPKGLIKVVLLGCLGLFVAATLIGYVWSN